MGTILKKKREELAIRPCEETEIDELMLLQENIYRAMEQPDWFAVTSRDENKRFFEEPNVILGVYDEDKLIAYGSVGFLRDSPDNLGWDLGWTREKVHRCAVLDTIVVDPRYRGLGLQRELIRRCVEYASEKEPGCIVLTTVSPDNNYSLRNVQAEGFEVLMRKEKYGGKERYILGKISK
ncbi:MAG: GNAT family N-acetyltransferase [Dorea sp.]|jgi:ribosomal protein S18 acetylase RimI-like enzyme|nr:GNAT family N-acetyltransferase [Dorea sp.]